MKANKRGPMKKEGFRQELRVTPTVENAFEAIKQKYKFKNNSDALHKLAEIYFSMFQ